VTWADLGLRMTTQATVMVSNPGFPEEPLLLIANLEGVWRLQDPLGSPALVPWTAWQRVDDRSTFFVKQDCPAAMPDVHADMDGRQPLPHGASMTTDVIGETVRVHGLCGAGCAGELRVDGVTRASLAPDPDGGEILAVVGGLAPGWHRVDLVGTGDASLQIDALEATDVAGFVDEPPEARCGCGGARGGATAALLALGLAVPRRRRAR
jgi:hypothetical protein